MNLRAALSSRFSHFASASQTALLATAPDPAEDDDSEEGKAAKAAKAAEDEEARKAAEDEETRKARRARKAKKSRKASKAKDKSDDDDDEDGDDAADDDEDEEDDEEMKKAAAAGHDFALDAAYRMGARAQRRRCAAILAHPAAATNPVLAMSLAFETPMTVDTAIGVMEKTPGAEGAAPGLARRMAGSTAALSRVGPGAAAPATGAKAVDASWDMVMKDVAPALR